MKMRKYMFTVIVVLIAVSASMAWGEDVPRWSVKEIVLTASGNFDNPYTQAGVTATFKTPSGNRITVNGFWNGGSEWRIRFSPAQTGQWSWSTNSADPGLNARSGFFTCVAPAAGNHGFLRRDPDHRTNFRWDDGTHAFIWGQTYYELIRNAQAGNTWRTAVSNSRRNGMNKVRFLIYPWTNEVRTYPDSQPFTGSFYVPDHDRLNLSHWQKLDEVIRYMESQGVIADLIVFADDERIFGSLAQNQRYLRYAISRFAAFHNVIWCLTNEWEYTILTCRRDSNGYIAPDTYGACKLSFGQDYEADSYQRFWNGLGKIVRNMDPWMADGAALRPLSIHQSTHHDFSFSTSGWPVHAIIQDGLRNRDPELTNGDEWGNYGIWYNLGNGMPVVNDEYGYINDTSRGWTMTREQHRRCIWGIATAGGYGSAGDHSYLGNGNQPYIEADWQDEAEYGDISRLVNFFTTKGLEYWKMSGHNDWNWNKVSSDIVDGTRVYALAEPGRQYVVYAAVGGTFSLYLPAGNYTVRRFDPRTGADTALQETVGGGWRSFTLPDSNDWIVYAKLKSADQPQPSEAVTGGIAGHWPFDEGSGFATVDVSGFGNLGLLYYGAFWAPGRFGYAVSLDGTDDYVSLARPVLNNRETFTLTAWFRTQAGVKGTIYNEYDDSGKAQIYLAVNEEASGDLEFGMFNDAGQWAGVYAAPIGLNNGTWHHVAVVQYRKDLRALFIDGNIRDVDDTPVGTLTLNHANMGTLQVTHSIPRYFTRYFAGQIDEVNIYDRSLSLAEIQNMAAGR